MVALDEHAKKLIDGKNFASVATTMPDGSPQVAPVWIEREDDVIVINATTSRQRYRNLKRDPRVAVSIYDQANPYSRAIIFGKAVEITKKGAEDHIDKLSVKYTGQKYSYHRTDDPRVIIRITPERVVQ